jgi:hypothetical protein
MKTENQNPVRPSDVSEADEIAQVGAAPRKRAFVEPEVTFPVDVLESTTFFQFTESGPIN